MKYFYGVVAIFLTSVIAVSASAEEAVAPATNAPAKQDGDYDVKEIKSLTKQKLKDIYDYSITLQPGKRQTYIDIIYTGSLAVHKMDKGLLKPEEMSKALKDLDKLYEGDGVLNPKEASLYLAELRTLSGPLGATAQPQPAPSKK
jgi:hypothetical protein